KYPDFPKKGILFRDIFPIFRQPAAVKALITHFAKYVKAHIAAKGLDKIDVVVGLDARGFLLGPLLALELDSAFAPVRKSGKLPGEVVQFEYVKEYGTDAFEMQADAVKAGQNVVIVDDLLATGGSAGAAEKLVLQRGANVVLDLFVVELEELRGSENLVGTVYSILKC
ncbi:adenine phosphoribosyltransferase, partial [Spiromyces aspiralis]